MLIVGLTGGLSTGKSTVAKMFKELGCLVINADQIAHNVLKDEKIIQKLVTNFGKDILRGKFISRKKMGEIVFKSKAGLKKLESIVHPQVTKEIKKKVKELRKKQGKGVVVEVPLLFEVGLHRDMDYTVVVNATQTKQIERAKKNLGLSQTEARLRIKAQMPLKDKIRRADFIIDNSKDLNQTKKQVNRIWQKLQ